VLLASGCYSLRNRRWISSTLVTGMSTPEAGQEHCRFVASQSEMPIPMLACRLPSTCECVCRRLAVQ